MTPVRCLGSSQPTEEENKSTPSTLHDIEYCVLPIDFVLFLFSTGRAIHLGWRVWLADVGLPQCARHLVARVAEEAARRRCSVVRVGEGLGVADGAPHGAGVGGRGRGRRRQLPRHTLGDADEALGDGPGHGVPAPHQGAVAHLAALPARHDTRHALG